MKKKNLFLIGPMGAGKSTVGKYLARRLKMKFYDSDQEIERRTGVDINWVFDVEGESGFRKRESRIISELTEKKGIVLATGGGSVILSKNRKFLSSRGIVIYLNITIEKQLIRTRKDKNRPLLQIKSSLKETLKKLGKERNFLYKKISDIMINADNYSAPTIVQNIINTLNL
ncbi:MAG: shikimate kinase AroK [Buchnera aphidicola (Periphyllus lyropictus)]|uniref:shikimate kinase AroK n=1 Tax=Buchnera aphidicola TaxID=9 RepID=UPI001ECD39B0|nr:shikimate kinase AroK [Buchnera aphidicola]NIH16460.1 shikimate kinase AroK [Buchnera aphidicola (Periphyllus lyropictus)]USS94745.1 shikimate kinase AroK [Buchnera aphidicola (Periphyllus lyropictus)]